MNIKGLYCISSSAYAEDKYVSSLTLENSKDKPVIIFKIFLRVGANYYIELDDFEHEPKILKPYESFTSAYRPVDFYCTNMSRIKLNELLGSRKVKKQLVLSTSEGKYLVTEWIKRWDPVFDFFNNHMTASIIPMRPKEERGYYGSDVKYLVKISTEDSYIQTTPVYSEDYNYPRFKNFRLTEESLSSKESLDDFLTIQAIEGKLNCVDVEVLDAEQLRNESYGSGFEKTFEAEHYSWFYYIFIGKMLTIFSNIRLSFINRKQRKANKKINKD
jgi:hypothetical protein